ncbi:type IV pilus secretin PilQ [Marinobacterium arenosum]|uniref:type IV pilus secretin PilQ n=1 Tax=Marinobacterium arenosum TaxID=2862496 RepID=UPI001C94B055|nr:type IV pilus secretin PilQ [Marinobacterium arenosum]MBY4675586.1 type IV pilus secretin PilQ [Marinobacterium arenosum]
MMISTLRKFDWLRALLTGVVLMLLAGLASAQQVMLKDVTFISLPNNKLEVKFDFDAPPPLPKSYGINQPPRLVLDFWGVSNELGRKKLDIKTGQLDTLNFAQTEGRLRVVANLYELIEHRLYSEGNSLYLEMAPELQQRAQAKAMPAKATTAAAGLPERTQIKGIDFERTGNAGRVVITLSDDRAGVDIIEEGNNVLVNLLGAELSRALEQRVDVQDFATPVMFIDSMSSGPNASVLVKPGPEPYEYMAYQTGTQLVLDFKPVSLREKEELEKDRFPYSGDPIDLDFQNVNLRAVLQIIAEVADLNLVVSDAVEGNITLRLKHVPWDQALDIVLKTHALDKRVMGNVLLVAPAEEIAEREKLELESSKQVEELAPLRTEFIQVDYRKASDMMERLKEASLVSERGFVMADDETNVLMVRETDKGLEEIRKTLRRFDVEVEQVLIEARLVTARSTVTKDLGIRWGFGYQDVDNSGFKLGSTIGGLGSVADSSIPDDLFVDLGATVTNPTSVAIGFRPGSSSLLQLELSALQTDGKAEIISQPKIVTTNGKAAKIESGREIPFQTVEDGEVSIEFKDVVLSLDVTPRINPGDRIAMELKIKQDSLGEVLPNGDISIDNNELETSVVVPDGQTIVLGGVFKNEVNANVNKTPLLGDLPVLGNLFRNTENSTDKTELLIFITPKLIRGSLTLN